MNLSKKLEEAFRAGHLKNAWQDVSTVKLREINAELLEALEIYQRENRLHNDTEAMLYEKAKNVIAKAHGENVSLVISEGKSE